MAFVLQPLPSGLNTVTNIPALDVPMTTQPGNVWNNDGIIEIPPPLVVPAIPIGTQVNAIHVGRASQHLMTLRRARATLPALVSANELTQAEVVHALTVAEYNGFGPSATIAGGVPALTNRVVQTETALGIVGGAPIGTIAGNLQATTDIVFGAGVAPGPLPAVPVPGTLLHAMQQAMQQIFQPLNNNMIALTGQVNILNGRVGNLDARITQMQTNTDISFSNLEIRQQLSDLNSLRRRRNHDVLAAHGGIVSPLGRLVPAVAPIVAGAPIVPAAIEYPPTFPIGINYADYHEQHWTVDEFLPLIQFYEPGHHYSPSRAASLVILGDILIGRR